MTVAGVIALAALAATVASLGYLHLAPTGLSPIRTAVSEYGITRFRAGYRAATIAFAVAGAALAVGIDRAVGSRASAVIALLAIFAPLCLLAFRELARATTPPPADRPVFAEGPRAAA